MDIDEILNQKLINEVIPIPTKRDVARVRAAVPPPAPLPPPEEPEVPPEEPPGTAPEEPGTAPEEPEPSAEKPAPKPSTAPQKPDAERKSERIEVRVSPEDKIEMTTEAEKLNLTLSAYLLFLHANHLRGAQAPPQTAPQAAPQAPQETPPPKPQA